MKKWVIFAIIYVLMVVGGYTLYEQIYQSDEKSSTGHILSDGGNTKDTGLVHAEHGEASENPEEHEGHEGSHIHESDVQVDVKAIDDSLTFLLEDSDGNPVDDLEIYHEKLLHLIIIGTDMKTYKHLHPENISEGVFKIGYHLPNGSYNAFVDIKPTNKNYLVKPVPFIVGEQREEHIDPKLTKTENLTVQSGGYPVTLTHSNLKAGEEVQLYFDLNGEVPEQYLGALGHVVIVDEKAERFLHVHPLNGEVPIFETSFEEPGLYKMWAEFKFNDEVFVFPYVLEVH